MANEIYSKTWWGKAYPDDFGAIYYDFTNGDTDLTTQFEGRVALDGGVVESIECFNDVSWNTSDKDWSFMIRVSNDGGILESFDCIN